MRRISIAMSNRCDKNTWRAFGALNLESGGERRKPDEGRARAEKVRGYEPQATKFSASENGQQRLSAKRGEVWQSLERDVQRVQSGLVTTHRQRPPIDTLRPRRLSPQEALWLCRLSCAGTEAPSPTSCCCPHRCGESSRRRLSRLSSSPWPRPSHELALPSASHTDPIPTSDASLHPSHRVPTTVRAPLPHGPQSQHPEAPKPREKRGKGRARTRLPPPSCPVSPVLGTLRTKPSLYPPSSHSTDRSPSHSFCPRR